MENPFDAFASDFRAAVPAAPGAQPAATAPEEKTIQIMAQPAPAPVQVMNSAPPMNGGMQPMGMPSQQGGMMMGGRPPVMGGGLMQPPAMGGGALVPSAQPTNPYASMLGGPPPAMGGMPPQAHAMGGSMPPAYGQAPPFGQAPPMQQQQQQMPYGAPPPQPVPGSGASVSGASVYSVPTAATPSRPMPTNVAVYSNDPFGAAPPAPTPMPAPTPAMPAAAPFAAAPVQPPQQQPPAAPPQQAPAAVDPWAAAPTDVAAAAAPTALVASTAPAGNDPFGIFGTPAPAAPPVPPPAAAPPQQPPAAPVASDPWADMGFDPPVPAPNAAVPDASVLTNEPAAAPRKEGELPPGGEWYDAKIFTPTLGVMFFKPQELTDSLFLQTDKAIVDALEERPVVAFIVEGSSARSAGVELGHVLLKVNGIDVKNPKEASRLIKEGPRPLPLLFYVPDTSVVVAEGEHMVKYDSRETTAPNSAKDWKPKYVVIGGIIAQPWMMNMYRSKSEYDIAVIETQARRPVSVKVKQFSLQGARIQNDWQGPQMVKYKNKMHPWKYIVILPISRNPIKISSPNLSQLKPVHEGIRRVLMAQQRDRPSSGGGNPHSAGPSHRADPYGQQQQQHNSQRSSDYDGRNSSNYGGQPASNYGGQPASNNNYSGGGVATERRRFQY